MMTLSTPDLRVHPIERSQPLLSQRVTVPLLTPATAAIALTCTSWLTRCPHHPTASARRRSAARRLSAGAARGDRQAQATGSVTEMAMSAAPGSRMSASDGHSGVWPPAAWIAALIADRPEAAASG